MSTATAFDIVGGYGKSEFPEFNPSELVNWYVVEDPKGKNGKALYPTGGTLTKTTVQVEGIGRRLHVFNDFMYAVISENLYRLDSTLNFELLGSLSSQSGYIGMENNYTQLLVVDGVSGWIWNRNTLTFAKVTDVDFPSSPQCVSVLANRFIVNFGETNKLGYSDLGDGTSWQALNTFEMTTYPDIVIAHQTLKGRLFVMGQRSTESWYDAGAADIPFRRDNEIIEFGCAARGSVAKGLGYLLWLSQTTNGVSAVVMTTGGNPMQVSSSAIDKRFQSFSTVSDATAYIIKNENGEIFYVINFPTENESWQFHINSDLPLEDRWSQLESGGINRHIGNDHVYFSGKHYICAYNSGKILQLSPSFLDDDGTPIRRCRISTILSIANFDRFPVNEVKIDMRKGTGRYGVANNDDPKIYLSISRDGGISYGNALEESIGTSGERLLQIKFERFGTSRSFVFKLEHYNRTQCAILGMSIKLGQAES